ncbi:unnamed protein product [Miscanthus lutarioriparius]|uniref:Uncharacterized protein n=1 Tax=Miscanthus lutarioriparius TaxID=422564 RepID=A0A811MZU8_9POAL|nr:unnamed protein product [Miscanthus lutarioriparius]
MIMKKEKGEASASTEEIAAPILGAPEDSVPPWGVIELSDDESDGLVASIAAAANIGPSEASPSPPRVAAVPNTSGD